MDRFETIKTMPLRRLVMGGFLGLALALLAAVGLAWLLFGAAHLGAAAAVIVLTGVVWAVVDRELAAREFDKKNLPARPE